MVVQWCVDVDVVVGNQFGIVVDYGQYYQVGIVCIDVLVGVYWGIDYYGVGYWGWGGLGSGCGWCCGGGCWCWGWFGFLSGCFLCMCIGGVGIGYG